MDKQTKTKGLSQNNILVVLLVIAALVIGYLWNEINSKKNTSNKGTDTTITQAPSEAYKLADIVKTAKADEKKFTQCMKDKTMADKVKADLDEGVKAGVAATPTSVIYSIKTNKTLVIEGALPFEGQDGIKEITDSFMAGEPAAKELSIKKPAYGENHWKGPKNAEYVLVVYDDMECPYCQRFHPTISQIQDEYKDMAVAYRHFPLSFHPKAEPLAEATECIADQKGVEGFWKAVDYIFEKGAESINVSI